MYLNIETLKSPFDARNGARLNGIPIWGEKALSCEPTQSQGCCEAEKNSGSGSLSRSSSGSTAEHPGAKNDLVGDNDLYRQDFGLMESLLFDEMPRLTLRELLFLFPA